MASCSVDSEWTSTVATSLTFMTSSLLYKTGCFTIRTDIACRVSRAVPASVHLCVFRTHNAEADKLDGVAYRVGPQLGPARHDQRRLTTRDEVHGHYRHTRKRMDILKYRGHAGLAHHSFDRVHRCTHRDTSRRTSTDTVPSTWNGHVQHRIRIPHGRVAIMSPRR